MVMQLVLLALAGGYLLWYAACGRRTAPAERLIVLMLGALLLWLVVWLMAQPIGR